MIRTLTLICALAAAGAAQPPAALQQLGVAGRTVDDKGQPLRKVILTLLPLEKNAVGDPLEPYGVTSDSAGKFEFYGVAPGSYRLMAEHAGYPKTLYGARNAWAPGSVLTLRAGQALADVNVRMTPQAVISGKVLAGDNPYYTSIYLLQERYQGGHKQWTRVTSAGAEPDGSFSINKITPGRYYLAADVRGSGPAVPGQSPERFVLTYYPGVTDIASAEAIELRSGQTLADLHWPMKKAAPMAVGGSILRKPAGVARVAMMLSSADSAGTMGLMVTGDTFRMESVPPGAYSLSALEIGSGSMRVLAQRSLQVSTSDIDGITLDLDPSAGPHGSVQFQGGAPAGVKLTVQLKPAVDSPYFPQADVKTDGTFAISGSVFGEYRLEIQGMPPNTYIKSAVFGEKDALGPLIFAGSSGEEKLAIVIATGAARISGVVRDEKGKALNGVVTLIPDPPQPQRTSLYQLAEVGGDGGFEMQGIRPGKYRLYAWEEFESGAQFDPDVAAPFQARSVAVEVAEGGRKEVALTRISVEEMEAARKAQLP
jgi:hypothetical protein